MHLYKLEIRPQEDVHQLLIQTHSHQFFGTLTAFDYSRGTEGGPKEQSSLSFNDPKSGGECHLRNIKQ